ncbi:hypothetical protein EIP86_006055 [Pleurotus ostreatoroseus]|nr:hypothetical protein EIP86_006055 [Pleurotus ostreatoroseus]
MAGAFSGHLVDAFLQTPQYRAGPFGQAVPPGTPTSSQLATHGPLAFAPHMHGTFNAMSNADAGPSHTDPDPALQTYMDLSAESARRIATLQAKLDKKLGPEYISSRPGPSGGPKVLYAEGWKIINLANEVFGFNGWSSSVVSMSTDYMDVAEQTGRVSVGVSAIVRVTLRDGAFHEDLGYGSAENTRGKGAALDKVGGVPSCCTPSAEAASDQAKKEAVTDGLKRALRHFGNMLGLCLYDKSFLKEITKIKVPPPPQLDKNELHRRPECVGPVPVMNSNAPSTSMMNSVSAHPRSVSGPSSSGMQGKSPMGLANHTTPVRPNNAAPSHAGGANGGLITPVQTPAHQQQPRPNAPGGAVYKPSDFAKTQRPPAPAPAPAPAPERRVSFAQPAGPSTSNGPAPPVTAPASKVEDDDDELYGLNSEDDLLYATIDLGEGDSGIGGHIDFDEGIGGVSVEDLGDLGTPSLPSPAAGSGGQAQRHQYRPLGPPAAPAQSTSSTSANPHAAGGTSARSSTTRTTDSLTPTLPPSSRTAGTGTPSTPTMGGFNFPGGSNEQAGGSASGPSSGIGLKRSADAMQPGAGNRRPMQGMGLSHRPKGQRPPLSTILLEGGDFKRTKR